MCLCCLFVDRSHPKMNLDRTLPQGQGNLRVMSLGAKVHSSSWRPANYVMYNHNNYIHTYNVYICTCVYMYIYIYIYIMWLTIIVLTIVIILAAGDSGRSGRLASPRDASTARIPRTGNSHTVVRIHGSNSRIRNPPG